MNIGLILFLSGIIVGNTGKEKPSDSDESQKVANDQALSSDLIKNNINPISNIKTASSNNINNFEYSISTQKNNPPSIHGNVKKDIKQDHYYAFTPYASDIDEDNLVFTITNKPEWCVFDSRTGSLTGQPVNTDVGITKNIVISVFDNKGGKTSLQSFDLEVINVNDSPIISGTPLSITYFGESYTNAGGKS